ncbi:unnamed protein product [Citrullus colocynthis]|uniref:Uncharacterized protein n=1 Tax=Citrullus colocynthis TaxID=252529 RepID=A0ABP0ZAR8_9ROSI
MLGSTIHSLNWCWNTGGKISQVAKEWNEVAKCWFVEINRFVVVKNIKLGTLDDVDRGEKAGNRILPNLLDWSSISLVQTQREQLEVPFTGEEISRVVNDLGSNKTP